MKKFLIRIGIIKIKDTSSPYNYDSTEYTNLTDKDKIEAHKNFLKSIEDDENNRLTLLESKTSQLISQTGIIFSLLSLFVPIFIDKVTDINILIKILLLLLLFLAFLFYMLTIRNALKNFNLINFNYSKSSPYNVIKLQKECLCKFYAEEVQDRLFSINQNQKMNDKKATNLLHSYNSFKLANTFTGILVFAFSLSLLFLTPKKEPFIISSPIKIENFDSSINILLRVLNSKKDTIYLKKSDTTK